jgi:threonine aldolase
VLAGSKALVAQAVTARRRFGGAMRQSGILAAAGLYALDHNIPRLAEDHANARVIAERIAKLPGIRLDLATVQSNIVIWEMAPDALDAAAIVTKTKAAGVLISALAERTVRAVTHMDVSREQCRHAGEVLAGIIKEG